MERFKYFFFQLLPVDNNSPVAGYLPSVRDSLEDYSEAEKDELIRELLDRNDEMAEENRRLEEKSYTDSMTGLRDSGAFYDSLRENVSRANRGNDFSLLMIDMNDFKGINDNYGHKKGDEVLKGVSEVLERVSEVFEESLREHDRAFRYGGDEFAVQLEGSDLDDAVNVAERIYGEIMDMEVWEDIDGELVDYGMSIGCVEYSGGSEHCIETTSDTLYRLADDAMYFAKESENSDMAVAEYGERFFEGVPAYSLRSV